MPIKVYHRIYDSPSELWRVYMQDSTSTTTEVDDPATPSTPYRLIAHLRTDDLEQAFAWSQHLRLGEPWHRDPQHVLYLHDLHADTSETGPGAGGPSPAPQAPELGRGSRTPSEPSQPLPSLLEPLSSAQFPTSSTPRSTSVGDILEVCATHERWLVGSVGFLPLPPRPTPPLQFPAYPHEWRKMLIQVWDVALAWRLIALRPTQAPDGMANLPRYHPKDLEHLLGVSPQHAMSDAVDLRIPLLLVGATAPLPPSMATIASTRR